MANTISKKKYIVFTLAGLTCAILLIFLYGFGDFVKSILSWFYGVTLVFSITASILTALVSNYRWVTKLKKCIGTVLSISGTIVFVLAIMIWYGYGVETLVKTTLIWSIGSLLMSPLALKFIKSLKNNGKG